jgi:D-alanyl-D-alanine carboxypeptidase
LFPDAAADRGRDAAGVRQLSTVPGARVGERTGPRRPIAWVVAVCVLVAASAATLNRTVFSAGSAPRPQLQRTLDGLVLGPERVAPGVTAFVSGPRGTWSGAAGLANVKTGEAMWPSAPMHLDSQTKTWMAAVILELVAAGRMRLDDTVEHWLPGVLPYGNRITVRELLNHTSGIVDQSTFDTQALRFIQRVHDPVLRSQLLHFWQRLATDPTAKIPGSVALRFTATLPLLWKPGTEFHYSNIGYEIAGLIAARAGGAPLGTLLKQRITRPLGLTSAAYVPGGEVGSAHPLDYTVGPERTVREATDYYRADEGASGAMIANARDDAHFLSSLMQGRLLPPAELSAMRTPAAANPGYGLGIGIITTDCHIPAYEHGGASYSTTSAALVSADGTRVAVILLNGNTSQGHSPGTRSSDAAFTAAQKLFCAA